MLPPTTRTLSTNHPRHVTCTLISSRMLSHKCGIHVFHSRNTLSFSLSLCPFFIDCNPPYIFWKNTLFSNNPWHSSEVSDSSVAEYWLVTPVAQGKRFSGPIPTKRHTKTTTSSIPGRRVTANVSFFLFGQVTSSN